jgi:hypothetical protein
MLLLITAGSRILATAMKGNKARHRNPNSDFISVELNLYDCFYGTKNRLIRTKDLFLLK